MGKTPPSLEQLLHRPDIWRGHSHCFTQAKGIDSGYPNLNNALQQAGWPSHCLIEACQAYHACEWWLFSPAIQQVIRTLGGGSIALINPPAMPFIHGLQRMGIDTTRLLVIHTKTVQEFVHSFTEVSQSPACPIVFAWQSQYALPYTQLRKLQLSTLARYGLHVLFRHERVISQSSPASLRFTLSPTEQSIHIRIVKQPGKLRHTQIKLTIPDIWKTISPHAGNQRGLQDISLPKDIVIFPKSHARDLKKEMKHGYY